MLISAVVVNTNTYDLILGNGWISDVKGIIDIHHGKMEFTWKNRLFEIPLDLHVGIRQNRAKEEEFMVTQFRSTPNRRGLTD